MSTLGNTLEEMIVNLFRGTNATAPTTVYLSLHTADPGETGATGELSGDGYARQAVTFGAPSDGVGSSSGVVTFGPATASWGTITHVAIWSASSGGYMMVRAAMAADKTIASGDSLSFAAGSLVLTAA